MNLVDFTHLDPGRAGATVAAQVAHLRGLVIAASGGNGGGINAGNNVHVDNSAALPYLAVAYALFFIVIFAYTISLSRRQSRVQQDVALLRRAIEEETP